MNPIVFYCILIYVLVVALSVIQSRLKIVTESPWTFFLLLVLMPIIVIAKTKGKILYTTLTSIEICAWTMMLAFSYAKSIVPRINEGYIYAYTLFHWYLLIDTTREAGLNFWLVLVFLISVYPTFLIIKSSFENRKLHYNEKVILYYWFLFAVLFTYLDQVAMDIITPILTITEFDQVNTLYAVITAVQLYFIATCFALIFVGIPFFHLDKSSDSFKVRWQRAKYECREICKHKLGNYVEYQISLLEFLVITAISGLLFYVDQVGHFRLALIFIYTVLFPVVFFYLKYTPEENIEIE